MYSKTLDIQAGRAVEILQIQDEVLIRMGNVSDDKMSGESNQVNDKQEKMEAYVKQLETECGRQVKRHMVNSGTFRGETGHSAEEYCAAMGVLQTAKSSGENIYEMVRQVFQRETPRKIQCDGREG